jgi:two-component system chemotaxis response regulator CheY
MKKFSVNWNLHRLRRLKRNLITQIPEMRRQMADILIVDDADFIRLLLRDILTNNGHRVVGEASDGVEAILKYREVRPDIVTMDIVMPKTNGIEAVRAIKAEYPKARIIMISALGQQKLVMESIRAGAKDFIVKPFNERTVVDIINKALL